MVDILFDVQFSQTWGKFIQSLALVIPMVVAITNGMINTTSNTKLSLYFILVSY